jgi:hypothetical protein
MILIFAIVIALSSASLVTRPPNPIDKGKLQQDQCVLCVLNISNMNEICLHVTYVSISWSQDSLIAARL